MRCIAAAQAAMPPEQRSNDAPTQQRRAPFRIAHTVAPHAPLPSAPMRQPSRREKICACTEEIRPRGPQTSRGKPSGTKTRTACAPGPGDRRRRHPIDAPRSSPADALLHPGPGQLWFPPQLAPRWRNWQTHQLEVLAPFTGLAGSNPVLGTTPRRCARRSERGSLFRERCGTSRAASRGRRAPRPGHQLVTALPWKRM